MFVLPRKVIAMLVSTHHMPPPHASTPPGPPAPLPLKSHRWRFVARARSAEKVYLVQEREGGISHWIPMRRTSEGGWLLEQTLQDGSYRFRYYTSEHGTIINCGNAGLTVQRLA